ncbi:hypothetical protein [Streptomyces sp. CB01881]|uniref:hypothetical protein n=1 Tax=Streptomyces sp. CB01881 TaxID=2078691 RepID=UPI000CDC0EF4|nr:hypothetical protein [Streptomyces sp. CB01881]AUY47940.1 hypothetical protein C2142_01995 [Streptomyces sp. CB01881]TYC76416.1 hypothetical protein EH183_01995 [Streptomyces sp. CB01881]
MGDWIWWAMAAVMVGGGWTGDRFRGMLKTRHERKLELLKAAERRQLALDAAKRPPEPVCGCTHHLAKHDQAGKCHETVEAPTAWDAERKPLQYEPRPCNCQQYIGPEPLGTVFATEITDRY